MALATAVLYPLKSVASASALGVVYVVPVLLASVGWGLGLGLGTALGSALAFNFFHLPPTGRFTIADSRNWVALVTYIVVAAITSAVAQLARSRALAAERGREEADLVAALARILLGTERLPAALAEAGARVAESLGVPAAELRLGAAEATGRRARAIPLGAGPVGTLVLDGRLAAEAEARVSERIAPALGALLTVALERERLRAEQVETDALRRADDVKTALLRAVSHDLRTPITSIVASGHALGSASLSDAERREMSATVVGEGERLATLVEKLLDLSRLQAGRADPRPAWTSLEDIVAAARENLPPGARIQLALAADLPPLRADPAQLERAFANLLENATRYSAGLPVSVRARVVNARLRIRVVDRGPGIPGPEQARIFEPFYRGGERAGHGGAGLGLAIVKGLVEANGGRIWVESLPGQGTSFVLEFPLAPAPSPSETPA